MAVKRMDNMGIVVADLDATVAFFAALGLALEGRATIAGEWAGRVTGLGDQHVEVAMMRTPDGHGRLELSRFLRPAVIADHRAAPVNALGYLRVMFAVDDLDATLARLGLLHKPTEWLATAGTAFPIEIAIGILVAIPLTVTIYLGGLSSMPEEIFEAARIDGASGAQRFRYLTLPLLTPAITISTLLIMTGGLKVYDLPYTFTKGGPGYATETLTQVIIQNGVAQAKFGQGSALAVVFLLLVGTLVLAQLFVARKVEGRYS